MPFDNLFSKIEVLWSDTMHWLRIVSLFVLFSIWLLLILAWLLMVTGLLPITLPSGIIGLLQYSTLILIVMINIFYIGAKYLQDIYEAPSAWNTFKYLVTVIFGFNIPKLKVVGGQKEFKGDYNTIEHIGGPGILQIGRDNVVAIETLCAQGNVLVAGERPISRFDFVRDVFSTEEQYGEIGEMNTLTADGIEVAVQNVQFRFRIDEHIKSPDSIFQVRDFIPSKKAVTYLTYQRPVDADGKSPFWTDTVSGAVKGIIKELVNNTYLDDLIAPPHTQGHPLDKLRNKFVSPQIHERFKNMGIKFISCNIGEISVTAVNVDKERLKVWFGKQSGVLKVIRAQGNSENFVSHERGRTEGQAMLLRSIANALQDIGIPSGDSASVKKNLRNILLTRTAQILEARTAVYHKHEKKEDVHDNSKRSL